MDDVAGFEREIVGRNNAGARQEHRAIRERHFFAQPIDQFEKRALHFRDARRAVEDRLAAVELDRIEDDHVSPQADLVDGDDHHAQEQEPVQPLALADLVVPVVDGGRQTELADAARIDGCSEFGIYWRIFVPLAVPAFITVAIFTFMASWNDFIGPLLYINSPDKFTVAIGLATFRSTLSTRWDLLMAASVAMTTPIVILFFVLQRYFIKGVVMTGIKG